LLKNMLDIVQCGQGLLFGRHVRSPCSRCGHSARIWTRSMFGQRSPHTHDRLDLSTVRWLLQFQVGDGDSPLRRMYVRNAGGRPTGGRRTVRSMPGTSPG
jgi:hypothetical protein